MIILEWFYLYLFMFQLMTLQFGKNLENFNFETYALTRKIQ